MDEIEMTIKLRGRGVTKGKGEGEAIVSQTTISFLGSVDPETGVISEAHHELKGKSVAGKIFVFPHGKGSTAGSFIMIEMANNKVAPAAVINIDAESIIAAGAKLASIPLVDRLDKNPLEVIKTGDFVKVDADNGIVEITRKD